MRLSAILVAGAFLLAGAAATAQAGEARAPAVAETKAAPFDAMSSAAKRKKRASGSRSSSGRSGTQIACTFAGCGPIPPGCTIRTGFLPFTWDPSGYDEVVCPRR